ncbi:MAG: PorT family protein [Flavobacteriales bacterium]|nr:PorT family protein [Flavobacteriales bacterium]
MRTKFITTTIALAFIPLLSKAQEFRFGGGYSASQVTKSGTENFVGKAGYQFGVDLLLGNAWFVKPGLHFQVRNLNYSYATVDANNNPTTTPVEFRYTDRSLRVPLHLGRRFLDPLDEPPVNFYVFAGPTALFQLDADLNNDALTVQTNGTQWYIGGGAGLELGFLFLEGGYDVAMTNVFRGQGFDTNPKLNLAYASLGVRLKLAR